MKYLKIYDSKMIPCGVINLDGELPSQPSNKFVKAYDENNKIVGVLEIGSVLTDAQLALTIHAYDENMNIYGNVPAYVLEKNVPNPNIILTPSSFTYSGNPCVPDIVVKDGETVVPSSEYTVEITNNVNAGTALVTITDKVGGKYKVSGTTTFQIAKANPTYTAPTGKENLEYTGEPQALLNAGSTNDGTIKYSLDGTNWGTTIPTGTDAQTYTVYWKLEGDANHNDVTQSSISVEVANTTIENGAYYRFVDGERFVVNHEGKLAVTGNSYYEIDTNSVLMNYVDLSNISILVELWGTIMCTFSDGETGVLTVDGIEYVTYQGGPLNPALTEWLGK